MRDPILITGAARSGTSMTAGIINICGAFGGNMSGPNKNNKKGMFENNAIRQTITKPYLKSIDCDPLGQKPLPSSHQIYDVSDDQATRWRNRVQEVFREEGYKDGPYFYKGAKACLFWYMWHKAFPAAQWVIVRREDNDIARSCMQTNFMRAYRDVVGWLKWVETHKKRFSQMKMAGLDVREVWPSKMINGDLSEIENVIKWLGLEYKEELVRSFIEPALWGKK